jgi:hypothetical protein
MKLTTSKLQRLVESVVFREQVLNECQVLTEASLARVLDKYFDIGFMVITADRTCEAERGTACTEEEVAGQNKINKQNEKGLKSDLAAAGFGFVPTYGGFRERVVDPETGEENLIDNPEPEMSFIVPAQKRGSSNPRVAVGATAAELKQLGMELSAKYNQDSFLFKPPASEDGAAYWITRSGKEEMSFDDVVANDLEQIYFTKLRKKPGRFSLTEDQQFALYIPKSPKSAAEARQRYGEIFIRVEKLNK